MKIQRRSKKFLFVSTAITIIALASVLTVSAAVLLGTINGGSVTVHGDATGTITYSTTFDGNGDTDWDTTLVAVTGGSWFTKLEVDAGYSGPVTITWQLESYATGSWVSEGTPIVTSFTLDGDGNDVYATANGAVTNNHDWSTTATSGQATYRVVVTISSA